MNIEEWKKRGRRISAFTIWFWLVVAMILVVNHRKE